MFNSTVSLELSDHNGEVALRVGYWEEAEAIDIGVPLSYHVKIVTQEGHRFIVKAPPNNTVCQILRKEWASVVAEISSIVDLDEFDDSKMVERL